jgi:hypothetical protein
MFAAGSDHSNAKLIAYSICAGLFHLCRPVFLIFTADGFKTLPQAVRYI